MITQIASAILGAGALPLIGGLAYRAGRRRQVARTLAIDAPNGIVEQHYLRIGGMEQWIQIRGEDRDNPVILVLHGGPGWSNAPFTLPLRLWEKHFTMVQWDQRGTGKTFRRSGIPAGGDMSFDCRVSDALELVDFLRRYLRKDKLILLAESMGTLTGLPLVKRRPDLFSAIVVTDLYVNMLRNEAIKYCLTLARLRTAGNGKGVAALEQIGGDPEHWDLHAYNVNMAWAFKTNLPTPELDRKLLFPLVLFSPVYNLRDIYTLFAGFRHSTAKMFNEFMAYDARRLGARFELPFFLIQGESDVITPTSLAEEYFAEVDAPAKKMALIRDAGHFAAFSRPDQFLTELLTHVRWLAIEPLD